MNDDTRKQIKRRTRELERDARRFAAEADMYAERIMLGHPYTRDFSALARCAMRVVSSAAYLDGMIDGIEMETDRD